MTPAEVHAARRKLAIRVSGFDPPKPVQSFAQCGFDAPLLAAISKAGYATPTAIQAQALPAVLSGRDVLVRKMVPHCAQSLQEHLLSFSPHRPLPKLVQGKPHRLFCP